MKVLKFLLPISVLTCLAFAQEPATAPEPVITAVHAAHLLDVRTGKMLDNVTVTIKGDRIASVAAGGAAPKGAHVIELPNATLLPGLIDAHTHLTFDPNFGYQELGISIPKEALIGAKNARITLEAGFTTIRNVGSGPALSITGGHCDQNLLPYEWHAKSDGAADGVEGVQHKVREIIKYG